MKSISILTFWGVPNYGAFAQAYALNKLLKKQFGDYQVKHIAYLHPTHYDLYYKKNKPQIETIKDLLSFNSCKEIIKYYLKPYIKYPNFYNDWLKIDHICISSQRELENYFSDIIVTGSDAIWEYSIPELGNDVHLIGNNLNCNKLVSYAASFGDMELRNSFDSWIKDGLKKYDKISVRDQNSKDIINKLIGEKPVDIVLDPTLMWDFTNDSYIPQASYKKYILVYGNDFPNDLIHDVVKYAKDKDYLIIGAGIAPAWCDIKLTDIGPLKWIGMFKNAEFVVTCTFHGLMFSINFKKKIVFNQVDYVKNRSTTLLKELGLYDLYKNGVMLREVLNYNWDYNDIYNKLNILRKCSYSFIEGIG